MWRIAIVFAVFIGFIVTLVTYTAFLDTDLVTENYYEQEVNYQDIIGAKKNGLTITNKIVIQQDGNSLSIHFPEDLAIDDKNGTIHFYHPKNANFDVKEQLNLSNNNSQFFSKTKLQKGNYTIKLFWESDGKSYYIEKNYYIS